MSCSGYIAGLGLSALYALTSLHALFLEQPCNPPRNIHRKVFILEVVIMQRPSANEVGR